MEVVPSQFLSYHFEVVGVVKLPLTRTTVVIPMSALVHVVVAILLSPEGSGAVVAFVRVPMVQRVRVLPASGPWWKLPAAGFTVGGS